MAKYRAVLTPVTDAAPAVVRVSTTEPSGPYWCMRFPGSRSIEDCSEPFRAHVSSFIAALRFAGATVIVSSTYRPAQRAHLMHWSWKIVRGGVDPRMVPAMAGVDIKWNHASAAGAYDAEKSRAGALAMVNGYGLQKLTVAPSLNSRHIAGAAVDMSISWVRDLNIADSAGRFVRITSGPRTGMNAELAIIGATYGVIKYNGSGNDEPHWSDTGR